MKNCIYSTPPKFSETVQNPPHLLYYLSEQEQRRGQPFSAKQRQWLAYMRDIIASSLTIEREDFNYGDLFNHGGLGKASELFGNDLTTILQELNERLAA